MGPTQSQLLNQLQAVGQNDYIPIHPTADQLRNCRLLEEII